MKNIFIVAFLMINCLSLESQIDPSYEIGLWKGFAKTAVSFTWDDNTSKQLTVGMPIFDKYDFKATFFVVTNWISNWDKFQIASDNGHEIASHTKTHTNFGDLNETERAEELQGSQNVINTKISNANCVSMAYPFCAVGTDVQTEAHYISARTCQQAIESSTPSNFMRVSSISCGTEGSIKSTADFDAKVSSGLSSSGWVVFLLHGIDNDNGYSPIVGAELDGHLSYLDSNREDFWVATYSQAVKYIRERDAASLVELSNADDVITIELSNELGNDTIYNEALSIEREMPDGWESVEVTQNGVVLESQIIEEIGASFIRFDAIPNAGNIVLKGSGTVSLIETDSPFHSFEIFPNPSHDYANLVFSLKKSGNISISIIDATGRLIKEVERNKFASGKHTVTINTAGWKEQLIYCVISMDNGVFSKRILVE